MPSEYSNEGEIEERSISYIILKEKWLYGDIHDIWYFRTTLLKATYLYI